VTQAQDLLYSTVYKTALSALNSNPDCVSLFAATNGSGFLPDPLVTGQLLSPQRVLTNIVVGNGGYGSITFGNLSGGTVATTNGVGLNIGFQGPYYSKVNINLDVTLWNATAVGTSNAPYDAQTLLHELGHASNLLAAGFGSQNSFASDGLSNQASQANSDNVFMKCFP
jgi:hypothetical protein